MTETSRDLHAAVDDLAAALHRYVDVARGVREESSDAAGAAGDPRAEDAARSASLALGRLDDAFQEALGMELDLGWAWEPAEVPDDATEPEPLEVDDFFIHLVVGVAPGTSPEQLDQVVDLIDEAGHEVVRKVGDAGFVVPEWSAARGLPPSFWDADYDEEPGL